MDATHVLICRSQAYDRRLSSTVQSQRTRVESEAIPSSGLVGEEGENGKGRDDEDSEVEWPRREQPATRHDAIRP